MKRQFNEQFWPPDRSYYAIALDRHRKPVDVCASNMGHCLATGIVDEDKAVMVMERLMGSEMLSAWGVRTVAAHMAPTNQPAITMDPPGRMTTQSFRSASYATVTPPKPSAFPRHYSKPQNFRREPS